MSRKRTIPASKGRQNRNGRLKARVLQHSSWHAAADDEAWVLREFKTGNKAIVARRSRRLGAWTGRPGCRPGRGGLSPPSLRVLVIEDDLAYAQLVRDLLASPDRGWPRVALEVTTTPRLADGMRVLQNGTVDVVLLDLGLPDSRGLATLARVRHQCPHLAVVVLTGADDERLAVDALRQGAQDYLIKTDADGEKLTRSIRYAVERERLLKAIEALSLTDELTGLYNRRGFFTFAQRQLVQSRRQGADLALLLADLDGLKQINDRLGHPEGDRALALVAECLRAVCREADIVARLGGDEFAVLLANADSRKSDSVARRLQSLLQRKGTYLSTGRPLSVSVGLAHLSTNSDQPLEQLIAIADAALYQHKHRLLPSTR